MMLVLVVAAFGVGFAPSAAGEACLPPAEDYCIVTYLGPAPFTHATTDVLVEDSGNGPCMVVITSQTAHVGAKGGPAYSWSLGYDLEGGLDPLTGNPSPFKNWGHDWTGDTDIDITESPPESWWGQQVEVPHGNLISAHAEISNDYVAHDRAFSSFSHRCGDGAADTSSLISRAGAGVEIARLDDTCISSLAHLEYAGIGDGPWDAYAHYAVAGQTILYRNINDASGPIQGHLAWAEPIEFESGDVLELEVFIVKDGADAGSAAHKALSFTC